MPGKVDAMKRAVKAVSGQTVEKVEEKLISQNVIATKKAAKAVEKTKKKAQGPEFILQYQYQEVNTKMLEERIKADYLASGHKASAFKNVKVYVKPEEYSAYYVVNDTVNGRVDLF